MDRGRELDVSAQAEQRRRDAEPSDRRSRHRNVDGGHGLPVAHDQDRARVGHAGVEGDAQPRRARVAIEVEAPGAERCARDRDGHVARRRVHRRLGVAPRHVEVHPRGLHAGVVADGAAPDDARPVDHERRGRPRAGLTAARAGAPAGQGRGNRAPAPVDRDLHAAGRDLLGPQVEGLDVDLRRFDAHAGQLRRRRLDARQHEAAVAEPHAVDGQRDPVRRRLLDARPAHVAGQEERSRAQGRHCEQRGARDDPSDASPGSDPGRPAQGRGRRRGMSRAGQIELQHGRLGSLALRGVVHASILPRRDARATGASARPGRAQPAPQRGRFGREGEAHEIPGQGVVEERRQGARPRRLDGRVESPRRAGASPRASRAGRRSRGTRRAARPGREPGRTRRPEAAWRRALRAAARDPRGAFAAGATGPSRSPPRAAPRGSRRPAP